MSSSTQPGLWQRISEALGSKLFRNWIIACVAGLFITTYLYRNLVGYGLILLSGPSWVTTLGTSVIYALVFGVVIGYCQWLVLQNSFRKAYWWIVVTALGYLALGLLSGPILERMFATFSDPAVWGIAPLFDGERSRRIAEAICEGIAIGVPQWLFFKSRRVDHAAAWIWVSIGAKLLSYAVPSLFLPDFIGRGEGGSSPFLGLYVLFEIAATNVRGIVYGFPTGLLLLNFPLLHDQQLNGQQLNSQRLNSQPSEE
ncbi:MAG: hypothetical protein AAF810_19340 [Cyanobacteria bacterium P01_D01_bin.36]